MFRTGPLMAAADLTRPGASAGRHGGGANCVQGPGLLNGAATEVGEFIEDHWILDSHLAIDAEGV